ncbi:MAG: hypothetical protein ILP12_03070 [Lachnospiraceae bacterium]|nr:hypothetical protein [Lachnospiraceae bacterium]
MRKIFVSDYTLRKFAQDDAEGLLFREKKTVAACLDAICVDQIELPPVTREKEDRIIGKTIAAAVQNSRLAIPAGVRPEQVEAAWQCVCEAARPCLQVMLPVSTAQMEYGFRAKEAAMLQTIETLVARAGSFCPEVEFSALDATRADPDFLIRACLAAQNSGATAVTVCDDVGTALPEEIASIVRRLKEVCAVPILVSLTDSIHLAPACALAALAAGADGVKTSFSGSDVLSTGEVGALVAARGDSLWIASSLKLTELNRDITETLKHIRYEKTPAAGTSAGETDILLDADSTLSDVCAAVRELGYDLSDDDCGRIYKALTQLSAQKGSLGARELEALIASNAMQVPTTYHLRSFSANCMSAGASMAQVVLWKGEDTFCGVATGGGPIDAAFRAIEQSIGSHYELDDFQIQAVTEGKEALGSALVRLRCNGKLYAGNGLSTDIVGASIQAYVNALNKIVFDAKLS